MEKEKPRKRKQKEVVVEEDVEQSSEIVESDTTELHFTPVERLIEAGINKSDIDKLKDAGFNSVEAICYATKKAICEVKGVSDNKYEKIVKAAREVRGIKNDFSTGKAFLQIRKNLVKITTGSEDLDTILGGGIESCNLTEMFGEFRTGKTQLCHTLCITCQLGKIDGGGSGKAMYIDTEGTFRPERLTPIAKRFNLDPEKAIENVYYARAYNHEHQFKLLIQAATLMSTMKFALLVVDSATHLYRSDFSGRGELSARQMHLCKFLRGLQKIADEFGVAVVMTNQVVASVDGSGFGGADKKPIGGHIMAHAPQTRLYLRKGAKENRICKIYDSCLVADLEATFSINEDGIRNGAS